MRPKSAIYAPKRDGEYPHHFYMGVLPRGGLAIQGSMPSCFLCRPFASVRYCVLTRLLLLSGLFKKWRHQKRQVDAENEKVFRAQAILARNHKARVLQAWRVVNQEQQIISPMVARRERKEMAR